MKSCLMLLLWLAMMPALAFGQSQASAPSAQPETLANAPNRPGEDGIGLAPARFELPMRPGTERTVVVNIIYNSSSAQSQPCRLMATLGDWTIPPDGNVEYFKSGTQPNSAAPWMIYSPGEVTALPGKIHPVRITIAVPKDAVPGDHLAALFVESRPDNLKLEQNQKQLVLRFRMAALFYIMVPDLTRKGSLENLKAAADDDGINVVPTIKNTGNSRIRPQHSIKVVDARGAVIAEMPEIESLPILGASTVSRPLRIDKPIAPGSYSVIYRVDFKDGSPLVEGQTDLSVKGRVAEKGPASSADAEVKKSGSDHDR
ncbi:MAG TPA: hypothetical protein VIS78_12350 [Blastocatellia bacterium]